MNTQQLEANSEYQRQQIENTIGEIRRRLSPGELLDEVLAYTKDGGSQFLSNFGRQATANPLPVTLIGAGLAWFLFSKTNGSSQGDTSYRESGMDRSGSTGNEEAATADLGQKAAAASAEAWNTVQNTTGDVTEQARKAFSKAKEAVSEGAAVMSESTKSAAAKARDMAGTSFAFLKDEPLVLLGAGLAIGAAVCASLPATEAEQNLVGEASAQLKSQVGEMASDQLDKVKDAGKDLSEDIAQSVKDKIRGEAPEAYH